ncbi:MAG: NUDIX domain-containing protein [Thermoanaerobaculia bacterium]|nr:NUDIX domain-containing protein [Thermoanaerobaculia bacterium]
MKKLATMVILRAGDHYLLLRRAKAPNIGKYVPVGGKLEAHERPVEAAVRETREETGIAIVDPVLCGVLSETSPVDYNWLCYIYLADIPWQEAPGCNEGVLEWIPAARLHEIPTPPTDLAIYDYVHRGEKFVIDAVYDAELHLTHLIEELSGKNLSI